MPCDDSLSPPYNTPLCERRLVHTTYSFSIRMATHIVRAKEPTILQWQSYYSLSPDDLLIGFKVRKHFRTCVGLKN
ncbi:uncharacterized protein PHACADRAFT_266524 [Phanerochaete carnosa HHB-10118-sp]|uniref:Uncharacterized protein n=1 Tax=Phanerochaete carnosa (strain HHB-10118-sp) TaxID=650164 RepID=K5WDA6_PHACS|nr:uncharacterized protein PHACADRAFT_266524 [Phanerochaete carnosa HHB-10118-sp]EKM48162.1 hypothetical protein PHACADRAFT_266524 [Phanerochaete carnosa HHB-10118-sp]